MRYGPVLFIMMVLTGCSTDRLSLVPSKEHLVEDDHSVIFVGRVSDSKIVPNYTFQENFLQPTPSYPSKGWKGRMTIDVLEVKQGEFKDRQLVFDHVRISNDFSQTRFTFFPNEILYVALDCVDGNKATRGMIAPLITCAHIVVPGDTLPGIAERYYGDDRQWRFVYESNRHQFQLQNPSDLKVGMELVIPPLEAKRWLDE